MPRPKKDVSYNASSETVRDFFRRSMEAREDQKDSSTIISALNSTMEAHGVHSGVMSLMRRIAATPQGKRGWLITLTRWYMDVLEDELRDPQMDIEEAIARQKALNEQRNQNITTLQQPGNSRSRRSASSPPLTA